MAFAVAEPEVVPKQRLLICDAIVAFKAEEGPLIVTEAIELSVQPLASVTVTLCIPVDRLFEAEIV